MVALVVIGLLVVLWQVERYDARQLRRRLRAAQKQLEVAKALIKVAASAVPARVTWPVIEGGKGR